MTTAAHTATVTATLLAVTDLRPVDWHSGKRLPLTDTEAPECDRCGRKHVKVYTVEVTEDEHPPHVYNVGSGCAGRMVREGLIPELEAASVKSANRAAREAATEAKRAEVRRHAKRVGEAVAKLRKPSVVRTRTGWNKYGSGSLPLDEWECDGRRTTCCAGTDADSMRRSMLRDWREDRATELLHTVPASLVCDTYKARDFAAAAAIYAAGADGEALIRKWK